MGSVVGERRRARPKGAARFENAGSALTALGTLLMALALGGAYPAALLAVAPLVLAGSLLASFGRPRPLAWPTRIAFGLAGFTLFQAVPLPIGLLEVLSPGGADIWARALRPLGESVRWGSISLDPGASMLALLCAMACVFVLSAMVP